REIAALIQEEPPITPPQRGEPTIAPLERESERGVDGERAIHVPHYDFHHQLIRELSCRPYHPLLLSHSPHHRVSALQPVAEPLTQPSQTIHEEPRLAAPRELVRGARIAHQLHGHALLLQSHEPELRVPHRRAEILLRL